MIRIEGVFYATREGKVLLDGIDCVVPAGELTVILGPNGAGKSTLLRVLSGERAPRSGAVYFRNVAVHSLSARQLALQRAVLGQQYSVSLPFTVKEVVMMGRYPHYRDRPGARDHAIVQEMLELVDAADLSGRLFNSLSGGEQQRVQLARALVQLDDVSGKYLLLDEPTASLDYWHQQLCLVQVRKLCRKGLTVVMILHDLNVAAQVADRLLVLKRGRLVGVGPPKELLGVELIREVYGLETKLFYPEPDGVPVILTNLKTC